VHPFFFSDRAEVRLEKPRELLRLGELTASAAVHADDLIEAALGRSTLFLFELFEEVIFAVSLVTIRALNERVGEHVDVTGGLPHLTGQDHARVDADDVIAALHHAAPPLLLDVLFELGAEWAVIPSRSRAAVDFTGLKDEAAVTGESDYLVKA
jgi:hypothetical protein